MKSIKEKADEFAITNKNSLGYIMQEHVDGYIAGANYVLKMFVDIVNKNTKPNGMEDRAEMASDMLILIKELKK